MDSLQESIRLRLKENPNRLKSLQFREPADFEVWAVFVALQLADVWSTSKGMQYDCVKELNPLLPSVPTVGEMLFLKTTILLPSYTAIHEAVTITNEDLYAPIFLTAMVVHNNLGVLDRVKRDCKKR